MAFNGFELVKHLVILFKQLSIDIKHHNDQYIYKFRRRDKAKS